MREICYKPIGVIHSPFKKIEGTPIQPLAENAKDIKGKVEVFKEYEDGLKDIEGFSHIILIYHFNRVKKGKLIVKPYMDEENHGVFATRAPGRPNPIGISIVKLIKVEKNILIVENFDILDGTPLLDIKNYVPEFDNRNVKKVGWLEKNIVKLDDARDDGRFGQ
ncbi:tRNA (N6-threonylcarbamoyladenosine(37)-N6)-methyltransferase TrmO [candidate division WOR-3 bacterium]|nr:tRNA (N6-threonylcarbamoyladenosine(37)-N6)-methyltransferase TrmO [candidate division WOR-3 bacterium]